MTQGELLCQYRDALANLDEEQIEIEMARCRAYLASLDAEYTALREAKTAGGDELAEVYSTARAKLRLGENALVRFRQREKHRAELEEHEAEMRESDQTLLGEGDGETPR